jgi:hypothetical protein
MLFAGSKRLVCNNGAIIISNSRFSSRHRTKHHPMSALYKNKQRKSLFQNLFSWFERLFQLQEEYPVIYYKKGQYNKLQSRSGVRNHL